jgi:hypothetical protein
MHRRPRARMVSTAALSALAGLSASGFVAGTAAGAGATAKPASTLTILVTNDDGVTAPGINASVQALKALPHTKIIVVAPLTNQSGTGPKVSGGPLTVTDATTASGYPAKAVAGYPADTVIWAIDDHGITQRPNLVVSGINLGENIGPLARQRSPAVFPPWPSAKASTMASRPTSPRVRSTSCPGCRPIARRSWLPSRAPPPRPAGT